MREKTIDQYVEFLKTVKQSGQTLYTYCTKHKNTYSYKTLMKYISRLKNREKTDKTQELFDLYKSVRFKDQLDSDEKSEVAYIRDDSGKIKCYEYTVYRKNKIPLNGTLTREEMNTIHRLYSYYGDSFSQRIISRHFVDLSLIDFKRILRAFNITKASAPFAPHMIEECTENELRDIQLREKENSFLRKAEEDLIKNNERLLKTYAKENIELKRRLKEFSEFKIQFPENIQPIRLVKHPILNRSINLYVADIHLGAIVTSGALYKENVSYGFEEANRRLLATLPKLSEFGTFDTINIVLMGDNIDCCGIDRKTARLTHTVPENMDAREQANKFMELFMNFIYSLTSRNNVLCSDINVYSVPCGNHAGNFEYLCNKALMGAINTKFPDIKTTLWEEFFGVFTQGIHTFVCCHGKDSQYMKQGLPLNLNDKSKIMFYEWLHENNIHKNNVHFIKGDLHSNSLSSCKRLDYRNVLSLFGASDYSNYNFSLNHYGLSYDLFIGDNLIRGTFENL